MMGMNTFLMRNSVNIFDKNQVNISRADAGVANGNRVNINEVNSYETGMLQSIGDEANVDSISEGGFMLQDVAMQIKGLLNYGVVGSGGSGIDSDKGKQKYLGKINARLQSGRPLTPKQIAYLQKNEPLLYLYAKIIEIKRKSVESQLKNCRSKEEAQRIQEFAMSSIGKNNPIREKLINTVNYTIEEFKRTDSYKHLPSTDKEANHHNNSVNKLKTDEDKQNDQEEDDTDDEDRLTVQYDISLGKYQEAFICKTNDIESSFSSIQC
ncbi:hypothetical protein [[Clostridium] fimetarium]|uniref:Uncharacterized protein n=1 Tax=[Clostridium] fimetarium TaxID=99656 RepID=A0A1I0QYL1_9FIRM|nr:hypothetical protein [[Clostridium] fimetarium]SEW32944.1 hypothetical protein SAMN05421659_11041 [[Clostridium] fimetarium]